GIRYRNVTGVQTCALPIYDSSIRNPSVRAITEGLRMEESSQNSNIRATIICPGATNTNLTQTITDSDVEGNVSSVYETTIEPNRSEERLVGKESRAHGSIA